MSDYVSDRPSQTADAGLAVNETDRLIASDKVEGTAVYDRSQQRLGSIHNVMLDKYSGQIGYAVISFGGFLGIGESYHPVPWKRLNYDTAVGGYVVDLTRTQLEGAPHYAADDLPWTDPAYGREVHRYYDTPYYL